MCTSAFSAGIIEAVEAEDIMNKLQLLVENNQQVGTCALMIFLLEFHVAVACCLLITQTGVDSVVSRTGESLETLCCHHRSQQPPATRCLSHLLSPSFCGHLSENVKIGFRC